MAESIKLHQMDMSDEIISVIGSKLGEDDSEAWKYFDVISEEHSAAWRA